MSENYYRIDNKENGKGLKWSSNYDSDRTSTALNSCCIELPSLSASVAKKEDSESVVEEAYLAYLSKE